MLYFSRFLEQLACLVFCCYFVCLYFVLLLCAILLILCLLFLLCYSCVFCFFPVFFCEFECVYGFLCFLFWSACDLRPVLCLVPPSPTVSCCAWEACCAWEESPWTFPVCVLCATSSLLLCCPWLPPRDLTSTRLGRHRLLFLVPFPTQRYPVPVAPLFLGCSPAVFAWDPGRRSVCGEPGSDAGPCRACDFCAPSVAVCS